MGTDLPADVCPIIVLRLEWHPENYTLWARASVTSICCNAVVWPIVMILMNVYVLRYSNTDPPLTLIYMGGAILAFTFTSLILYEILNLGRWNWGIVGLICFLTSIGIGIGVVEASRWIILPAIMVMLSMGAVSLLHVLYSESGHTIVASTQVDADSFSDLASFAKFREIP